MTNRPEWVKCEHKVRGGTNVKLCRFDAQYIQSTGREDLYRCSREHVTRRPFTVPRDPTAASQCGKVLAYVRRTGSISDLEAYSDLGIRRLAARVFDLRERGFGFTTTDEKHDGGTHARYRLHE